MYRKRASSVRCGSARRIAKNERRFPQVNFTSCPRLIPSLIDFCSMWRAEERVRDDTQGYFSSSSNSLPRLHDFIQNSLYWIATHWHCHQLRARSFSIRGRQLPLCARCVGILLGPVALPVCKDYVHWPFSVFLIVLFLADGTTQMLGFRESKNWLRFVTGVGFSLAVAGLIFHGAVLCLSNIRH